jgi:hypothetical protein
VEGFEEGESVEIADVRMSYSNMVTRKKAKRLFSCGMRGISRKPRLCLMPIRNT